MMTTKLLAMTNCKEDDDNSSSGGNNTDRSTIGRER